MKQTRWYETQDDCLVIYDAPEKRYAQSMSICAISDISYYRKMFNLKKVK